MTRNSSRTITMNSGAKPPRMPKLPFSVGSDHSTSAIRKPVTGHSEELDPDGIEKEAGRRKQRIAAKKKSSTQRAAVPGAGGERSKRRRYSILTHDGQPRFEGGFSFYQAGLPELGKPGC
jgi:hypothetical protein